MAIGKSNIADKRLFKKSGSGAGKGDTPRTNINSDKWQNAELWKNFGPTARNKQPDNKDIANAN